MIRIDLNSSRLEAQFFPQRGIVILMTDAPRRPQCPITGTWLSAHESEVSSPDQSPDNSLPPEIAADSTLSAALGTLPEELLLILLMGGWQSEHILAYLASAEWRETDAWSRDDYRIAWLCVLHCAEGISHPWEYAFWRYLGKHPDKLIPLLVERAAKHAAMNVCSSAELHAVRAEEVPAREGAVLAATSVQNACTGRREEFARDLVAQDINQPALSDLSINDLYLQPSPKKPVVSESVVSPKEQTQ